MPEVYDASRHELRVSRASPPRRQVELTLTFEGPFEDVVVHFQELVRESSVRRYEFEPGRCVVVNDAVQAALTISEGRGTLEVSELHLGMVARIALGADGG